VLVDNLYAIAYDASSGLTTNFEYDANRQVTLVTHASGSAFVQNYGYSYRNDGFLGGESGTRLASYDYDGRKQLIAEGPAAGTRDGYDPAGNRLWRASTAPPPAQQATFDAQNRLLDDGAGTAYTYDANGNMLTRTPSAGGTATTYTYDGMNRLRAVDDGRMVVSYTYDADGRLVGRTASHGGQSDTRRYRYAQRSMLAEVDSQGHVVFLHTRDDKGRLLRQRSSIPVHPAPSTDPHSLFVLSDGLGNVVRMLDWDGTVHVARDYDAWGESRGASAQFGYRGGYHDPHTGLLNFGARWYDPSLGRWLSQDPLPGMIGSTNGDALPSYSELANLYLYVLNNPLGGWDPTGLSTIVIITSNYTFGTHAAVYVSNDGNPVLYDPGGTYKEAQRGPAATYLEGDDANLGRYLAYQKGTGSSVATYRFATTSADEAAIVERIAPADASTGEGDRWIGDVIPACAYHVSQVLQGIGPFKELGTYLFPGRLGSALEELLHPGTSLDVGWLAGFLPTPSNTPCAGGP
jgi:RHS repeat-associated protein